MGVLLDYSAYHEFRPTEETLLYVCVPDLWWFTQNNEPRRQRLRRGKDVLASNSARVSGVPRAVALVFRGRNSGYLYDCPVVAASCSSLVTLSSSVNDPPASVV